PSARNLRKNGPRQPHRPLSTGTRLQRRRPQRRRQSRSRSPARHRQSPRTAQAPRCRRPRASKAAAVKSALLIFNVGTLVVAFVSLSFFVSCFNAHAQSLQTPQSSSISLPTELRVRGSGWWPTKGQPARAEYTGPDACTECHELKAETAQDTAMLHAATRASDSKSLRDRLNLPFQAGPYNYQLLTTPERSILTVTNATSSMSVDLLWALGSGHMGQTFIYQQNGRFYESHVSFYSATQALDITPGQQRTVPATLDNAAGRAIPPNETRLCFGCHTTASTTKNQFDPSASYPGVTCEACHGPGAQHIAAVRAKKEKR